MEKEEIRICNQHDKEVPLIFTFAFNGSEYWCPYCGANFDIFGSGRKTQSTPELKKEAKEWKQRSKDFLHAKAVRVCHQTKWRGKWIAPSALPEKEKERLNKVIKDWKYEVENEIA